MKAGGPLWTTTGPCASDVDLVSIDPISAEILTYPEIQDLYYCPHLFTSPTDPNVLLGMDTGLTPTTVVRLDVSTGAPVVVDVLRTDNANGADGAVLPDGKTLALASGWPYEIRTFTVDPLEPYGIVYPTRNYPVAVETTAANGGLLAAANDGSYDRDVDVFRAGHPEAKLFTFDLGSTENTVYRRGLAFSADGTRLFAVSGVWNGQNVRLNVFEITEPRGRYTPLTPARILDTRTGTGGMTGPVGPWVDD